MNNLIYYIILKAQNWIRGEEGKDNWGGGWSVNVQPIEKDLNGPHNITPYS